MSLSSWYRARFVTPIVPIIHLNPTFTAEETYRVLQRLTNLPRKRIKAIGVLFQPQHKIYNDKYHGLQSTPANLEIIISEVKRLSQTYSIPVHAYGSGIIPLEAYYFATQAQELTLAEGSWLLPLPTTSLSMTIPWEDPKGRLLERSGNHQECWNRRAIAGILSQREQALAKYNPSDSGEIKEKIREGVGADEAVALGLADRIGSPLDSLYSRYGDCVFQVISLTNHSYNIKKIITFITSPILVLIFLFKVILKYSILFYLSKKALEK